MNEPKVRSGHSLSRRMPWPVRYLGVAEERIEPGQAVAICFDDDGRVRVRLASGQDAARLCKKAEPEGPAP